MENNEIAALAFSIVVVMWFLMSFVGLISSYAHRNTLVTDDYIALYVDTLDTVDSGSVMMPVDKNKVRSLRVSFETKGEKEHYSIPADGWYVIVTYKPYDLLRTEIVSASRLYTYPPDISGAETVIPHPENVCIVKGKGSQYAEVRAC